MSETIRDSSLFFVQTDTVKSSIRYDVIKEAIGPLAKPDDVTMGLAGTPGLMWPGSTLEYDPNTGELNVEKNPVVKKIGEIGYGKDKDGVDQRASQLGDPVIEKEGYYYVVGDWKHKYMQNDWGSVSSDANQLTRVYVGDEVQKKFDGSGDWEVIHKGIGDMHLYIDFSAYPHISQVGAPPIISVEDDTVGGTVLQVSGD